MSFVARKGSPDTLDEEIKYLSDIDAAHAAQSYGLIKIIIWAIPILGFLGTVIGITIAIASLQPEQIGAVAARSDRRPGRGVRHHGAGARAYRWS